jgi:hypothetical protein
LKAAAAVFFIGAEVSVRGDAGEQIEGALVAIPEGGADLAGDNELVCEISEWTEGERVFDLIG